jgi:hypothetical protein
LKCQKLKARRASDRAASKWNAAVAKKGRQDAVEKTDKGKSLKATGKDLSSVNTSTRETARKSVGKKKKPIVVVLCSNDSELERERDVVSVLAPERNVGGDVTESCRLFTISTGRIGKESGGRERATFRNSWF